MILDTGIRDGCEQLLVEWIITYFLVSHVGIHSTQSMNKHKRNISTDFKPYCYSNRV